MSVEEMNISDRENLIKVGFDFEEKDRAATFLQEDNSIKLVKSLIPGVEILPIEEALEKYSWVKEYYGKAFQKINKDFYKDTQGGYFIWIKKNTQVFFPIQACLFIKKEKFSQRVHNLVIIDENAQGYIITGCTVSEISFDSSHLGISEFFIKKGGYLNFTMIHKWQSTNLVEPKTVAIVEEKGSFISNYICLHPVKKVVMYPEILLVGEKAKARFNSLLFAHPDSFLDIGSKVTFKAPSTSAELISRAISDKGEVIVRGHLQSQSPQVKAHLECQGLMLSDKGKIWAIPQLETSYQDVDMSHEAAIGKINREEIEYLCSRTLTEKEAKSVIVRGFMNTDILFLPQVLKKDVERLTQEITKAKL